MKEVQYKCVINDEDEIKEDKRQVFKNKINEWGPVIKSVVITELIFIFIFTVFLANCYVPTASMDPTIHESSRVIANRLSYINNNPKRTDIIAFKYPDHENIVYCKRIIGLPGETLEIIDGVTYINGVQLGEEYIKNTFTGDYGPFYIPKKGDIVDYDYKNDTAICNNQVVGNINFLEKYCIMKEGKYIVDKDCYFCLGDNRDNSEDARFWQNHYVTKNKIVGKMFYNLSSFKAL